MRSTILNSNLHCYALQCIQANGIFMLTQIMILCCIFISVLGSRAYTVIYAHFL